MEKSSVNSETPIESRQAKCKEYEPRGPLVHIDGCDSTHFGFDLEADVAERFLQMREMARLHFGKKRRRKFR